MEYHYMALHLHTIAFFVYASIVNLFVSGSSSHKDPNDHYLSNQIS